MREIFIERREKLLRVSIKENNILKECYIEEETNDPLPGELYKGKVKRIVKALKSAFVDIGNEKQAYMHLDKKYHSNLKNGDEVLVEVIKEQLGTKGAKVVSSFSLPGRYVVLNSFHKGIMISKKIIDDKIKDNLLNNIKKPDYVGITIRTNAQNVTLKEVQLEIDKLSSEYDRVLRDFKYSLNPKKLYGDNSLIHKVIRDNVTNETKKITVDSKKDYDILKKALIDYDNLEISIYESNRSLFDYYGIEKEILSLRNNKVNLKCGGDIVIEKTEAMYVVDVNSAKNINSRSMEKTIEETNIEACKEIARQIKLRNLSGIILVDFINMKSEESKKKVLDTLNKNLLNDKQKATVYPFTELNLIQIVRKRSGKSIYEYIEEDCLVCNGHGKRLKLEYIYLLIRNEILKSNNDGNINDFYIEINSIYEKCIREDILRFLTEIDGISLNIYLNFKEFDEYFKVEPLIFKNQIENVKEYQVKNIEKY